MLRVYRRDHLIRHFEEVTFKNKFERRGEMIHTKRDRKKYL